MYYAVEEALVEVSKEHLEITYLAYCRFGKTLKSFV
jgi:hypothetical protein